MCGIVGIASINENRDKLWLKSARDKMTHRGPDGAGEWWSSDNKVGLGHRRLSIIELSQAGSQPMIDESNKNVIVFNGELYNYIELKSELLKYGYVFNSNSDTEVLMASYNKWGFDCLSKFNGMFSFAIYDDIKKILFLARDRAGEKPLFYSIENNTIKFASELKSLLCYNNNENKIDIEALNYYLNLGYVPGGKCIVKGFNKLKPAHALTFNLKNGDSNIWKYWNIPELIDDNYNYSNESNLLLELESLLESSVGLQLTSDVPLGILLSGGVDSSLITAMACRNSKNIKTFTIGFPGYGKADESLHAKLISDYFGTEHIVLNAEPPSSDLIYSLARQFDEPIVDSSMIPTFLVSQLVKKHCTVALGGDGGDELFGGYTSHRAFLKISNEYKFIPKILRQTFSNCIQKMLPIGFTGRNYIKNIGLDFNKDIPVFSEIFDKSTLNKLLPSHFAKVENFDEIIRPYIEKNESDLIQRLTRTDFNNYLPEDILVKVDRASMLNSLEIRAPFLDYRIIEFAYSKVPSYLKTTTTDQKILLKKLAQKILPKEFDLSRKQGFSIPLKDWLKSGSFRDLFFDVLNDSQCIFDKKVIQSLFNGLDNGYSNGERLFSLVIFELWRREYSINV